MSSIFPSSLDGATSPNRDNPNSQWRFLKHVAYGNIGTKITTYFGGGECGEWMWTCNLFINAWEKRYRSSVFYIWDIGVNVTFNTWRKLNKNKHLGHWLGSMVQLNCCSSCSDSSWIKHCCGFSASVCCVMGLHCFDENWSLLIAVMPHSCWEEDDR